MGGSISRTPDGCVGSELDAEEDPNEILNVKLIFLRDAMIQMRGQFLHFQHVYKFWQSDEEQVAKELKMLKIVIMVIHKGIEDLKTGVDVPGSFMEILSPRIENMCEVVSCLILEIDELKNEKSTIMKLEDLINKLNPFDVPSLKNLEDGDIGELTESTDSVFGSILKQHNEDQKKRLEKLKRGRIQEDEETELRHDKTRIILGHRKIQAVLEKPVVLFINSLDDEKTLKTMKVLNQNKIDYTVFDVSFDPEIRFVSKDLSDCETFPQLFVDCDFKDISQLGFLIESLPKLV